MEDKAYLTKELAEELNCSVQKIYNVFKKHGKEFVNLVDYVDLRGEMLQQLKQDGSIPKDVRGNARVWSQAGLNKMRDIIDGISPRQRKLSLKEIGQTGTAITDTLLNSLLSQMNARIVELSKALDEATADKKAYRQTLEKIMGR